MSVYAGIDYSSYAIDLVLLDEDTNRATHIRRRLDTAPGDATARIRRIRDALPPRANWADTAAAIGIEKPMSRTGRGADTMQFALGAILACIPTTTNLALIRADDWRRTCGLPVRAAREQHKRNAIDFAARMWTNRPATIDDNAADAFAIAWATRHLTQPSN